MKNWSKKQWIMAYMFVTVAGGFAIIRHTIDSKWDNKVKLTLRILVILQGILFVIFTYNPLNLGIFINP